MDINKICKGLLVGASILFVVVALALLYFKVLNPGNNNGGGASSTVANGTTGAPREQEPPAVSQPDTDDSNPKAWGGDIRFNLDGGEYTGRVRIQLSADPLKSSRGDIIASDIYYTFNGNLPTKINGKRYSRGGIYLSREGTFTLKARLLSRAGEYEGGVYSREYTVQPVTPQVASVQIPGSQSNPGQVSPNSTTESKSAANIVQTATAPPNPPPGTWDTPPVNNTITDFESLDTNTKDEILENMNRIILEEVVGIANIKKTGDLKILIAVSKKGKGILVDISGLVVEPADKMGEIKSALNQRIADIAFNPPTMGENPVDVETWLAFKKVAKFYEKVIFER